MSAISNGPRPAPIQPKATKEVVPDESKAKTDASRTQGNSDVNNINVRKEISAMLLSVVTKDGSFGAATNPLAHNSSTQSYPPSAPPPQPQNIIDKIAPQIETNKKTDSLPPTQSEAPVESHQQDTHSRPPIKGPNNAATFAASEASGSDTEAGKIQYKLNTSYNVQTGMEKEVNAARGSAGSAANVTIATNVLQTVLYSLMKNLLEEFEKSALESAENSTTMATVSFDIQTEGLKNSADMIKSAFDMSSSAVKQEKESAKNALAAGMINGAAMVGSGLIKAGGGFVSNKNPGGGAAINAAGDILHGGLSMGASQYDYDSRIASATAKSYDATAQALNATQSNSMQAFSALAQNAQKTSSEFDQFMQTFLSQLTGLLPNVYQALSGR